MVLGLPMKPPSRCQSSEAGILSASSSKERSAHWRPSTVGSKVQRMALRPRLLIGILLYLGLARWSLANGSLETDVFLVSAPELPARPVRLEPQRQPGDVVGQSRHSLTSDLGSDGASACHGHEYLLTEFVRVQSDKNVPGQGHGEQQSPSLFFTPALGASGAGGWPRPQQLLADPTTSSTILSGNDEAVSRTSASDSDIHIGSGASGSPLAVSTEDGERGAWLLQRRTNRGAHGEVWRGTRVVGGAAPGGSTAAKGGRSGACGASEGGDKRGGEDLGDGKYRRDRDSGEDVGDGSGGNDDGSGGEDEGGPGVVFVLKRMLLEKGPDVALAGHREVHFGERLAQDAAFDGKVAKFVEVRCCSRLSQLCFTSLPGRLTFSSVIRPPKKCVFGSRLRWRAKVARWSSGWCSWTRASASRSGSIARM